MLNPQEQDNLVATLLSYVVFKIFCQSPEHKTYRINANRSRDYAKRKLEIQDKDIEVRESNLQLVIECLVGTGQYCERPLQPQSLATIEIDRSKTLVSVVHWKLFVKQAHSNKLWPPNLAPLCMCLRIYARVQRYLS